MNVTGGFAAAKANMAWLPRLLKPLASLPASVRHGGLGRNILRHESMPSSPTAALAGVGKNQTRDQDEDHPKDQGKSYRAAFVEKQDPHVLHEARR